MENLDIDFQVLTQATETNRCQGYVKPAGFKESS